MADSAANLRSILAATDMSAPAIHKSAGSMMKHYDRSAEVAVTEWRNVLQTAQPHQLLPLWYVANEVLQNSRRNRGNKFLEAFAPILGQSMISICSRSDAETVEKVRRTAKIWGDRQVFSVRYIGELLRGVEQYRHQDNSEAVETNFSPIADDESPASSSKQPTPVLKDDTQPSSPSSTTSAMDTGTTTTASASGVDQESSSSDEDSLGFGGIGESGGHLDISLHIDTKASFDSGVTKQAAATKKRRRGSLGTARRKSVLSTTSLMELWTQVESLQQGMENSQSALQEISDSLDSHVDIDQLVGDELLDQFKLVVNQQDKVQKQRRALHGIANDRRALEKEAVRYIPWLQRSLVQDEEDIAFCSTLSEKLHELQYVHGAAKAARDEERQLEAERRAKEEEEARKKREEEERKQMLESAMKTEQEAKPGQVWNKALQEYVYLNTDESWRD